MFLFAATQRGFRRSFPRRLRHRLSELAVTAVVAFTAHVLSTQPASAQASERPNIVLIMADDMGFECVTANGGQSYQTTHLDRLAASGMRFQHCYSQPLCTPSRVPLMTGIYNSRNYVRFGLLDPQARTFGSLLKQGGYTTCIVGKWQLEGGFDGPTKFGFDDYCLWQLGLLLVLSQRQAAARREQIGGRIRSHAPLQALPRRELLRRTRRLLRDQPARSGPVNRRAA